MEGIVDRVGFVGLGVMGLPMAGHLADAGWPVTVWNRTPAKAEPLRGRVEIAGDLAAVARSSALVFLCVGRTEDVEEVLSQLVPHAAPGTLFVDHSTISPQGARRIHESLDAQGHRFLDAPLTGGSKGAQAGTLTIFCGGSAADFAQAHPAMASYSKRAELTGGPGSGQLTKMVNQIAVAGSLLGLCEAMAFAERAGLDPGLTRELVAGGAAGSWALDNYGPKILARDWTPGFSIANQRKDFGYCRESGEELNMPLPMTELCDALLAQLHEEGRGEDTTAALFEAYLEMRRDGP
jgi:3-hydroxyisobutyrate dehydrogenase-like beta-hydroxyacid dehydrogenase